MNKKKLALAAAGGLVFAIGLFSYFSKNKETIVPSTAEQEERVYKQRVMESLPKEAGSESDWRTFEAPNYTMKLPDNWPDASMSTLNTKTRVEVLDILAIEDGAFKVQDKSEPLTYEEYVAKYVPQSVQVKSFGLGKMVGMRYFYENEAGPNTVNVILAESTNSRNLFVLTYYTNDDEATATKIVNPVIESIKFN